MLVCVIAGYVRNASLSGTPDDIRPELSQSSETQSKGLGTVLKAIDAIHLDTLDVGKAY